MILEEYDIVEKNRTNSRDNREKRLTRTESFKKRYKENINKMPVEKEEEEKLEFSQSELNAVKDVKGCPFCNKNNVNIQLKFFLNYPHKRYCINHHCSTIRCDIETEYFSDIKELVDRWNGDFVSEKH